jgi:hypothetical protein
MKVVASKEVGSGYGKLVKAEWKVGSKCHYKVMTFMNM